MGVFEIKIRELHFYLPMRSKIMSNHFKDPTFYSQNLSTIKTPTFINRPMGRQVKQIVVYRIMP